MTRFDTHHAYTRLTEAGIGKAQAETLVDVFGRAVTADLATRRDLEEAIRELRQTMEREISDLRRDVDQRFTEQRNWTLRLAIGCLGVGLGGVAVIVGVMG